MIQLMPAYDEALDQIRPGHKALLVSRNVHACQLWRLREVPPQLLTEMYRR